MLSICKFYFLNKIVCYIYSVINEWLLPKERKSMLKYLVLLVASLSLNAQEGPKKPQTGRPPGPPHQRPERPKLTEEQKKQRSELIAKYDADKDGKLNKEERTKVSDDDRKTMRNFGPPPGGPRGPRGPKHDGPPPTKDGERPGKPHKKN